MTENFDSRASFFISMLRGALLDVYFTHRRLIEILTSEHRPDEEIQKLRSLSERLSACREAARKYYPHEPQNEAEEQEYRSFYREMREKFLAEFAVVFRETEGIFNATSNAEANELIKQLKEFESDIPNFLPAEVSD